MLEVCHQSIHLLELKLLLLFTMDLSFILTDNPLLSENTPAFTV